MSSLSCNRSTVVVWLATGLLWLACCAVARGQNQPAAAGELTRDGLRAAIDAAESDGDLAPELKSQIVQHYKDALELLGQAASWTASATGHQDTARRAPDDIATIKALLSTPLPENAPQPPAQAALAELQQALSKAEDDLKSLQQRGAELEEQRTSRVARRENLARLQGEVQAKIEQLPAAPQPESEGRPAALVAAEKAVLEARRRALSAESASYKQELEGFDICGELIVAQLDEVARKTTEAEGQIEAWRAIVNDKRKEDEQAAAQQAEAAKLEANLAHPELRPIFERNAEIAESRAKAALSARIESVSTRQGEIQAELKQIMDMSTNLRSKVDAAGLTQAVGELLRRRLETLPNVQEHRRHVNARREAISGVRVAQIDLEDERSGLTRNASDALRSLERSVDPGVHADREQMSQAVIQGFNERRDLLDGFIKDYDRYLDLLTDLDQAERKLIRETLSFSDYIQQRIMWIRSASFPGISDLQDSREALGDLLRADRWATVWPALRSGLRGHPFAASVGALLVLVALFRGRCARRLAWEGSEAVKPACITITHTLRAAGLTLLVSGVWPGLILLMAWLMRTRVSTEGAQFCAAVGNGLHEIATAWWVTAYLRLTCQPQGLGPAHFGWSRESAQPLRQWLGLMMIIELPLIFFVAYAEGTGGFDTQDSIGRLALIASVVVLAVMVWRQLRHRSVFMQQARLHTPAGWLLRWRWLWLLVGVALPLAVAGLSLVGFHYTAVRLSRRIVWSAALVVGLAVVRSVALRWFLLAARRLAREQYQHQREASADADSSTDAAEDAAEASIRLGKISEQSQRLLRAAVTVSIVTGLYIAWSDIIPALRMLDNVVLWTSYEQVFETQNEVDGTATTSSEMKLVPVTLVNLGRAIILMVITIAMVRNLPGLLEITLLLRLPLNPGERYAISTVVRYFLIIVGMAVTFREIGVGWNNVQWLAAAVSVGLGFGLQEIFANFVSGLILLFERPVRIGDTVTVGEAEGSVARIQMRATTLVDWDRKEVVIPNRELITGRIINWSLNDPVLRVVVPVRVSYGSDPQRVQETLLKVARNNERVLGDPAPMALFLKFGEHAMEFDLRVYVQDMGLLSMRHELHNAILTAFREAGIEIAFPQRDLHIRSLPAGADLTKPHIPETQA